MKESIDKYIEQKIEDLKKHFKDQFIESLMMQEHQKCTAISKKLLKAKEAKIFYKNKATSAQSLEDLKEKIDKDNAFGTDLKVKI